MYRGPYKCDSCARYENEPVWGHIACSAHRECAGSLQWEPHLCSDCNIQRDMMDFMSDQGRKQSFHLLIKLLERTKLWKFSNKITKNWHFQQAMGDFMSGFEIPSPPFEATTADNRNTDDDDASSTEGIKTPGSFAKYFRPDSYRPVSCNSERSASRNSVQSAMNEQTREIIDRDMSRESTQQANYGTSQLYGTNDVPSFQVVPNNDGFGYEDNWTNDSSYTPAFRQTKPQIGKQVGASCGFLNRKRLRSPSPVDGDFYQNQAQGHDENGDY